MKSQHVLDSEDISLNGEKKRCWVKVKTINDTDTVEFSGGSTAVLGTHFRLLTFKIVLFPESFCDIFSLAALSFSPRNLTYKKDSFPLARTQERLGHIPHVLCFLPGNVSFSFFLFFFLILFSIRCIQLCIFMLFRYKKACVVFVTFREF